jgi:hypothetical protein
MEARRMQRMRAWENYVIETLIRRLTILLCRRRCDQKSSPPGKINKLVTRDY